MVVLSLKTNAIVVLLHCCWYHMNLKHDSKVIMMMLTTLSICARSKLQRYSLWDAVRSAGIPTSTRQSRSVQLGPPKPPISQAHIDAMSAYLRVVQGPRPLPLRNDSLAMMEHERKPRQVPQPPHPSSFVYICAAELRNCGTTDSTTARRRRVA